MDKKIYCGDYDLPDGYDKLGTRFRCLQKGYGIGKMIEEKEQQKGTTKAINRERKSSIKIYCGPKHQLPLNYDKKGTRYECLRRGVGAGIYNTAKKYRDGEYKVENKRSELK